MTEMVKLTRSELNAAIRKAEGKPPEAPTPGEENEYLEMPRPEYNALVGRNGSGEDGPYLGTVTPHEAKALKGENEELKQQLTTATKRLEKFTTLDAELPADWREAIPRIATAGWDDEPIPQQEWAVHEKIPVRNTTLFSGAGGAGKSILQLMLSVAHVLGKQWLGTTPAQGPAIFIDTEDDDKVVHRRLADITRYYGVRFADVEKDLHLVSLVGRDAVLAAFDRKSGRIEATTLYRRLLDMAGDLKPRMIGIASSANVFAGNELDRSQVNQFVGLLTAVAMRSGGGVVLISHPSLTGMSTGTGISGTTQWHNAVRARIYLKGVKPGSDEQPDSDLREIEFMKNQYGKISERIGLRYQNGLFLPIPGGTLDAAVKEEIAKDVFIKILLRFTRENRYVGAQPGPNYAPTQFAKQKEAEEALCTKAQLTAAMEELLRKGGITLQPYGRPSNLHYRLACEFRGGSEDIPF